MADAALSSDQVRNFLAAHHGEPVDDVEPLSGGFWSSAFGYRVGDRELVVRFGTMRDGFEADRRAMAFDGPDLPVPPVLAVGDAFDGAFAVSERRHGRFLESARPEEADVVGATVVRLLGALRAVPTAPDAPVAWEPTGPPEASTWRGWVVEALQDDPSMATAGWRRLLAADDRLDALFRACERRVVELTEALPERRDVLHGDLLHANVLMAEDASRLTAVFSWKCSQRGDFLFDAAWCTFWGGLLPGIGAAGVFERVLASPWAQADPMALVDAAIRHHCYELQIGATHLGWHAWTGDADALEAVAAHTAMLLERGPSGGAAAPV